MREEGGDKRQLLFDTINSKHSESSENEETYRGKNIPRHMR